MAKALTLNQAAEEYAKAAKLRRENLQNALNFLMSDSSELTPETRIALVNALTSIIEIAMEPRLF